MPHRATAAVIRRFPRRPNPVLDRLLAEIAESWPSLAARAERLPPEPPPLSALALTRAAGLTVFVLGAGEAPLLVAKLPGNATLIEAERAALERAEPVALAPRFLGRVGAAYVQEGLPGQPLEVVPPGQLQWNGRMVALTEALARLGEATARPEAPDELAPVELALEHVDGATHRVLAAAWRDVSGLERSVLRHGDTSAQNCLFLDGRLAGLVDWERAQQRGAPGFDVWNAAVAFLEHGVGLARWSQENVAHTFRDAWLGAWGGEARVAAAASATAAGVPERLVESLEVVFFARRLGRRLARPDVYATTPATAAAMLSLICAR